MSAGSVQLTETTDDGDGVAYKVNVDALPEIASAKKGGGTDDLRGGDDKVGIFILLPRDAELMLMPVEGNGGHARKTYQIRNTRFSIDGKSKIKEVWLKRAEKK